MPTYTVDVSWRVAASIELDVRDEDEARRLALALPIAAFSDREYISDSFTVDQLELIDNLEDLA